MSTPLTEEQLQELKSRHIRSFCMRRGHISAAQQRALDEIFPRYEIVYDPKKTIDGKALFGNENPLVLEIGCGMGETTAAIAKDNPHINFIGCEVFAAGVGALSRLIEDNGLKNIRLCRHDAYEVVRDMIPYGSLAGVHIFFPDPWRKARHHKRRLIAPPFMAMITPKLKIGGYFHCATDWENYAEQMLEVLNQTDGLYNFHPGASPLQANPLVARPETKFHKRGERLGHGCWDFVFYRA